MAAARKDRGGLWSIVLGCVPFAALVGALPWVNRVEPMILGLPFLLFWIFAWVALTPVVLFAAYLVERRHEPPTDERP